LGGTHSRSDGLGADRRSGCLVGVGVGVGTDTGTGTGGGGVQGDGVDRLGEQAGA
jgi:hypothetical protein